MKRLTLSILSLCLVALSGRAVEAADRAPNIVLLYADDLGYADIGPFGAKGYKTPHLDRLAREGRRFTNFHVSQPVCSASRTSLLTGCYANRLGIHGALGPTAKVGISDQETTIAELVKTKGYATGMAGKWHLGHLPQFLPVRHGFDEYLGLPYSNDMWPRHPAQKKANYPPLPLISGDKIIDREVLPEEQEKLTGMYTERAVSFIKKHKSQPFFFYLAYAMPHVPLFASEAYRGKSGAGIYGDVISEIDGSVGSILKALDDAGVAENTLVIFTSDNGPWLTYGNHAGSAGPLREGKGTCWEGGVRVPCLMRWPGKIPAGTTGDDTLMTIDLLPTIAGLIGADLPKHPIDGRDVAPILTGQANAKNPHDAYYFFYRQGELHALTSGDGRWKLQLPHAYDSLEGQKRGSDGKPGQALVKKIEKAELYDLKADIGERKNVADQHPDVVARLTALADKAREDLGDPLTKHVGKGNRPVGRAQ